MTPESPTTSPEVTQNSSGCASGACPLTRHRGLLLWVLLISFIAYMQWPMLKGMYYKASGAEAPASAVTWQTDFDAALDESARSGKPLLVDFTASWCPPCKVMKHEVWPDGRVAEVANEKYVPVLIDVDEAKNAAVAGRYGVRSIPTILVLDGKGEVLRTGGFMSVDDMLSFLKSAV
jgi:thiol:disulfide interchange protein